MFSWELNTFKTQRHSVARLLQVVVAFALLQGAAVTTVPERSGRCPHHFAHRVRKCLEPYWSIAALFSPSNSPRPTVHGVLTKQLCLHFEMALVCLHSALTDCPSAMNVKHVQSKLGSDWAMETRALCLDQSGTWSNHLPDNGPGHADNEDINDFYNSLENIHKTSDEETLHRFMKDSGSKTILTGRFVLLNSLSESIKGVHRKVRLSSPIDSGWSKCCPVFFNIFNFEHEPGKGAVSSAAASNRKRTLILVVFSIFLTRTWIAQFLLS